MTCGLINSVLTFLFCPLLGAASANACLKGTIGGVWNLKIQPSTIYSQAYVDLYFMQEIISILSFVYIQNNRGKILDILVELFFCELDEHRQSYRNHSTPKEPVFDELGQGIETLTMLAALLSVSFHEYSQTRS